MLTAAGPLKQCGLSVAVEVEGPLSPSGRAPRPGEDCGSAGAGDRRTSEVCLTGVGRGLHGLLGLVAAVAYAGLASGLGIDQLAQLQRLLT